MKKDSRTFRIIAIAMIVCAVALNVLGFVNMNRTRYERHFSGNGFMSMSYYTTSYSLSNTSMAMIVSGGFLFIGGVLILTMSMHEGRHEAHCRCRKVDEPEAIQPREAENPESEDPKAEGQADRPEYQTPQESFK